METNKNKKQIESLFVIGYIASGKSTYVESIKRPDDLVIELGSIVREITHQEKRTFDNNLDDAIYDYCRDLIGENIDQISRVIFVAPRSPKLLDRLIKMTDNYKIVYLFVPPRIREARFYNSKRAKDEGISYEDALRKDASIGMEILIDKLIHGDWGSFESVQNFTAAENMLQNSTFGSVSFYK